MPLRTKAESPAGKTIESLLAMLCRPLTFVAMMCLGFGSAFAQSDAPIRKDAILLNVSQGAIPGDTGSDGKTIMTIEKSDALGGLALKVVFASGDSFGDRVSLIKNWKIYKQLRMTVLNPQSEKVDLELNLNHAKTTGFQTRTVHPITLNSGKNTVAISMDELVNVNGSKPDLANVLKWYVSCAPGKTPTLFFSDLVFEGGPSTTTSQNVANVSGDPARLARIRATQMPKVDKVISFDTPEADAVLSALEVFPANNPWNLVISDWPVHRNSKKLINSVGADKILRVNDDMCFLIVPPNQPKVEVKLVAYPDESDRGPFPIPDNLPIEGWPKAYSKSGKPMSLADVQRRPPKYDGDRHGIVVDPTAGKLYEFFVMGKTPNGWAADQSSVFDLKSNRMRPTGWTSADAAGLPIFPAVIRYDELQRGEVEHAMRFTVRRSRKAFVYPATHHAGHGTDESLPRMGDRFRLRQNFETSGYSPPVQAILKGLKKYGMFVADNGLDWALSMTPDLRIPDFHEELRTIKGADFEVVEAPEGYQPPTE